MLTDEGRESIQQSNRTRGRKCGKCGAVSLEAVDGARIGGLAGVEYLYCVGCGWSTTKTKRARKGRL